jgi:phosphate transport system substrate-binding protein
MLRTKKGLVVAGLGALALTVAACGSSSSSSSSSGSSGGGKTLNGAGATFPAPIYQKWAGEFASAQGIKINYQAVGSGAGIQQFTSKTVDFGASDAPMKDDEIAAAKSAGGDVLHIPMVLGSVVATYNLSGVSELKLDGPTLASIFDGKITKWNDPAIAALNSGATLPDKSISVEYRADSSGTTFIFTGYLSGVSPEFKSMVGQDKAPKWPVGTGAPKNDGVAAAVKQTDGAIGYVELAYALKNSMPQVALKNKSGEFIKASLDSTTAAAKGVQYPSDLRFDLLDSTSAGAYPIVSATWQLVWADPSKAGMSSDKAKNLVAWLNWELTDGQKDAPSLNYAPLPDDLLALAKQAVTQIKTG